MIKQNHNLINNNFWFLFTQLISQFAKMHGEINITIKNWEWHFQKLQYGQSLDENSQNATKNSEMKIATKNKNRYWFISE